MTKRRSMKRALFSSVMSISLCFTMLLGTTFAWFTDSAVSGSNVIKSGNLDIEVQYTLDGETWKELDGATDLFQKGLWEPGHTEVVALKIANKGSLALKYAANMNIVDEKPGTNKDEKEFKLSEILTVSTLVQQAVDADGNANQIGDITLGLAFKGENRVGYENTVDFKAGNVLRDDVELQPGAAHYAIIKVDMADTVGNEANYKTVEDEAEEDKYKYQPSIDFGINVLATQFTYENDSFGNQYDADADMPLVKPITAVDELNTAFSTSGNYTLGGNVVNDSFEIKEKVEVTLNLGENEITTENSITNNGTVVYNDGKLVNTSTGYGTRTAAGATTTYNDVEIVTKGGGVNVWGSAVFNNGSIVTNSTSTSGRHVFYVAGPDGDLTINGGEFTFSPDNLTRKGSYIYADGEGATVVVNDGVFHKPSSRSGHPGIVASNGGTVTIYGGTFQFDPSDFVAEGYQTVKDTDGWWTVSEK